MRRPGSVVAAAIAAVATALALVLGGTADAQNVGAIAVAPAEVDPGGTAFVTNAPGSPCTPPSGSSNATASVDLYAPGSVTPANRVPFQGFVSAAGAWSVEVRLAPDLAPGRYRVQAGCYTDSGLNSKFGPAYDPGRLEVRLRQLGPPTLSTRRARPGDGLRVTSGDARCTPPTGAPSPRVRVSILDRDGATRAEAEGGVDGASGQWSLQVRVPSIEPQSAEVSAVCLARVGASVPYARYGLAPLIVEAAPAEPPATPPTTAAATPAAPPPVPGAPSTTTTVNLAQLPDSALPVAPVAKAIIAEPTYTG